MNSGESRSIETQPHSTRYKRGISSPEETGPDTKRQQNKNTPNIAQEDMANVAKQDGDMTSGKQDDFTCDSDNTISPTPAITKTWEGILQAIHDEVRTLRLSNEHLDSKIDVLTNKVSEMQDSIDFISEQYDEQKKDIDNLKKENILLVERISAQDRRIDELEQYSRKQNVLFDSIEETEKENTDELISDQCKKIGIHLQPGDLHVTHRLGKPSAKPGTKPRAIIARFASANISRQLMMAVKQQFKSSPRPDHPVHARFHLSEARARLLGMCIRLKSDKKIAACWTYNYRVFLKKDESDTQATEVRGPSTLKNLGLTE